MTKADFELLVRVIAAFFGTDAYIDRVGEDYHSEGNLLFDVDDKNQKKAFMLAIEAAKMAEDGKSIDEITSHITNIRKNV